MALDNYVQREFDFGDNAEEKSQVDKNPVKNRYVGSRLGLIGVALIAIPTLLVGTLYSLHDPNDGKKYKGRPVAVSREAKQASSEYEKEHSREKFIPTQEEYEAISDGHWGLGEEKLEESFLKKKEQIFQNPAQAFQALTDEEKKDYERFFSGERPSDPGAEFRELNDSDLEKAVKEDSGTFPWLKYEQNDSHLDDAGKLFIFLHERFCKKKYSNEEKRLRERNGLLQMTYVPIKVGDTTMYFRVGGSTYVENEVTPEDYAPAHVPEEEAWQEILSCVKANVVDEYVEVMRRFVDRDKIENKEKIRELSEKFAESLYPRKSDILKARKTYTPRDNFNPFSVSSGVGEIIGEEIRKWTRNPVIVEIPSDPRKETTIKVLEDGESMDSYLQKHRQRDRQRMR